jgi:hypothetical protein
MAARSRAHPRRAPGAGRDPLGPGAGGPPGRLAEVDVSGSPVCATSRSMPLCDVWRTAMPPSRPRSPSGSRPSPPRSTSVSGPGQNASDNARADAVNTRPHASAIIRPDTRRRNGLPVSRPLSPANAVSAGVRAAEPSP